MENNPPVVQPTVNQTPVTPITLVMSAREMRCYTVTESELKQLGLANLAIAGTFGLGSALFAFGLDVYKDVAMTPSLPESAKTLAQVVQPLCFYAGIAFWVFAAALFLWRHGMLSLIKKEAKQA